MKVTWSPESLPGGDPCRAGAFGAWVFARQRRKPWLDDDPGAWELFLSQLALIALTLTLPLGGKISISPCKNR